MKEKSSAAGILESTIEKVKDWLEDKDSAVKGGEKLAIYFDCIIEGK